MSIYVAEKQIDENVKEGNKVKENGERNNTRDLYRFDLIT